MRKRFLVGAAGLVLVVATFAYLLPTIADYRDVWEQVRELSWEWGVALVGVAALNVVTFAPPWQLALPGLGFVCALGVGADEVSTVEAFAAWSLVRIVASIPITPGGVGVIELGLTTALVAFGGGNAEDVAAVLVYRFLSGIPTRAFGLLAVLTARRHVRAVASESLV